MDIIVARLKAANFLLEILDGVELRVSKYSRAFDTGSHVVEYRFNRRKGEYNLLRGNMVGWVAVIRPDLAKFEEFFSANNGEPWVTVLTHKDEDFTPAAAGIPISSALWSQLTDPLHPVPKNERKIDCYYLDSTFSDVYLLWKRVAKRIMSGEMDEHIILEK